MTLQLATYYPPTSSTCSNSGPLPKKRRHTLENGNSICQDSRYRRIEIFRFFCCNLHIRTAVIIIAILDAMAQSAQIVRSAEVLVLISQCRSTVATMVAVLLITSYCGNLLCLISFCTGIAVQRIIFIVPTLFRYALSFIFDTLFIAYATVTLLSQDISSKRPLIWLYKSLRDCPPSVNFQNSTVIDLHDNTIFDEADFIEALNITVAGLLILTVIQLALQIWYFYIIKRFCEYLLSHDVVTRNSTTDAFEPSLRGM